MHRTYSLWGQRPHGYRQLRRQPLVRSVSWETRKVKRTRRGEDDTAATEGLSSGLVRLFHCSRRVLDSKETTRRG